MSRRIRPHRMFPRLSFDTLECRTMPANLFGELANAITDPNVGQFTQLKSQLDDAAPNHTVPVLGSVLNRATGFVDDARGALHSVFQGLGDATEEAAEQAIFDALGNEGGLDILGDVDVELTESTIEVSLSLRREATLPVLENGFDLGLPSLPFNILSGSLQGGLEFSAGIELNNLRFGFAEGLGYFDFDPSAQSDLVVDVSVGLSQDFQLEGAIGFVHGEVTPNGNTGVSAILEVDLNNTSVSNVTISGTGEINLLLKGEPLGPNFPAISANLHVQWPQLTGTPLVEFENVSVEIKSNFLAPIIEHLEPIFNAAGKVVSVLEKPIPVLSDLSEAFNLGEVTALSILNLAADTKLLPKNYNAIIQGVLVITELVQIADGLSADDGTIQLNFGDFPVGGLAGAGAAGDITGEGNNPLSALKVDTDHTSIDLESIENAVAGSKLLPQGVKDGLANLLKQLQNGVEITFPIFDNPVKSIFPLFLGQNADFVRLDAQFHTSGNYDETFGLPLGFDAGFFGGITPSLDLTFGYDTNGVRTYLRNLFDDNPQPADARDLLNGFYFTDDTGFKLTSAIGVQAGLNAVLFHAGVEGGVEGYIEIGVVGESTEPKKVYLRNGDLGADLFSLHGGIKAYLEASVGVGIDLPFDNFVGVEKKWRLASRDLVKFNTNSIPNPWHESFEGSPNLASELGGVLMLHVGALRGDRAFATDIIDEAYTVVSTKAELGETGHVVEVYFNGQSQRFSNVTSIVGDAGDGNDFISVVLDPAWTDVVIDITGGSGNDILEMENGGTVTLRGGSGDDNLTVTDAMNVVIEGHDNDDQLTYVGTGTANISGDNGHDSLWGGDGTNKLYGGHGNDALYGGKGANFLYGEGGHDTLVGGSGTNEQYGGTGNDHLTAGPNGDHLEGGSNDDVFVTGTGNDQVIVGETSDVSSFEQISWVYGNGSPTITANNSLTVKLEVLGSPAADIFRVRNAAVNQPGDPVLQLVVEAPDDRTITGSGLDDIHIDGRHGDDVIRVMPLSPTLDVDRIGINLSDNLDDDHAVDLIEVLGNLGADNLIVDHEQVVLKEYKPGNEPGVDAHGGVTAPPHPEQLLWGGVMTVRGMPNYTVYAMNNSDDLRVLTQGGNDTVSVNGITGPTRVDLGSGNDTITVSAATNGQPGVVTANGLVLPDFATELQLELGSGVNNVTIDEGWNKLDDTIVINENRVHSGILPGVNWQATGGQVGTLLVFGTKNADVFQVLATSPTTSQTTVLGRDGNDTFQVGNNGKLESIRSSLSITAGSGNSTAVLNDRNAIAGNANVQFNNNSVTGLAGPTDNIPLGFATVGGNLLVSVDASNSATQEQFTLNNFQHGVRIEGNLGNDKFVVGLLPRAAELRGGTGIDRYTVGSLDKLTATLTISDSVGLNQILVDDTAAIVGRNYELNANALNVFGNAHDEIVLTGATGTLDVQATNFNDQFREVGSPGSLQVTVNLRAGTNTLVGPDSATTWTLNGINDVTVGSNGRYRAAQNLVGGAANDRFAFTPAGSITGTLFGGGGTDTLDYSARVAAVSVDLQSGVASGVTGLATHVENVTGGSGNDVLLGNANPNLLDGGAGNDIILGRAGNDQLFGGLGRDLLIGGLGADVLQGGGDDDILIGGTTTHDGNLASLNAIHGVWVGGQNYVTRVTNLRAGLLTMATVQNDMEPDSLFGQAGLDWFWWFPNDNSDRVAGELDR